MKTWISHSFEVGFVSNLNLKFSNSKYYPLNSKTRFLKASKTNLYCFHPKDQKQSPKPPCMHLVCIFDQENNFQINMQWVYSHNQPLHTLIWTCKASSSIKQPQKLEKQAMMHLCSKMRTENFKEQNTKQELIFHQDHELQSHMQGWFSVVEDQNRTRRGFAKLDDHEKEEIHNMQQEHLLRGFGLCLPY